MNSFFKKSLSVIRPYRNIIYFVVLLMGTHYLWKFAVDGDLHGQRIAVFGMDATSQFHQVSRITAQIVWQTVCLFPYTETFRIDDTYLYFADGKMKVIIIWGCTAVKQLYIFLVIMLFFFGPFRKKLWYIPLGCLILFIYNIIRISLICAIIKNHPELFNFLHEGVFRYIFYGLIFLLWLIWEERISKPVEK